MDASPLETRGQSPAAPHEDAERKKREQEHRIKDDVRDLMRAHEVRVDSGRYRAARRYIDSLHKHEIGTTGKAADAPGRKTKRRHSRTRSRMSASR